ncbi:DUF3489 domain-containing protein [Brevundimonas sp. NPDC092305]|uniref:DUF3489 domain-containing protein n=1 Tax=Brevundimonas sp. NPDC092305 TaxID=3363957 RepID=UPI003829C27A
MSIRTRSPSPKPEPGRVLRAARRASRQGATHPIARIPVEPRSAPAPVVGKLGLLVSLMRRPEGASLQTLCDAVNWRPHSVRGALAGSLKRTRGYQIASDRIDGVRVYRIAPEAEALA